MIRFWFALAFVFCSITLASAQNVQCPTRPPTDDSNACASTAFVQNATGGGVPTGTNAFFRWDGSGHALASPLDSSYVTPLGNPINASGGLFSYGGPPAGIAAGALANGMTATTQTSTDNSAKLATDAFVQSVVSLSALTVNLTPISGGSANCTLYDSSSNVLQCSSQVLIQPSGSALSVAPPAGLTQGMLSTETISGSSSASAVWANENNVTFGAYTNSGFHWVAAGGNNCTVNSASFASQVGCEYNQLTITQFGTPGYPEDAFTVQANIGIANQNTSDTDASLTGGNDNVALNGTGWSYLVGREIDNTANEPLKVQNSLRLVTVSQYQGSTLDAMIDALAAPGVGAVGWHNLIYLDDSQGTLIDSGGCVLCTAGSGTVATGINLSGWSFSGYAWLSPCSNCGSLGTAISGVGSFSGQTGTFEWDQNNPSPFEFSNRSTGASAVAEYVLETHTTNSSAFWQLADNSGSPNSSFDVGTAVTNVYFRMGGTNIITETAAGGVQIGAPTGGDCGVGCLNAGGLRVNNVAVAVGTITSEAASDIAYYSGSTTISGVSITGLVKGNGSSAPTVYGGASCTNQVVDALSAAGAATCVSITNAYLSSGSFTNITGVGILTAGTWEGTVVGAVYGGTGEANNSANTITFSGNYGLTLTLSNTTSVTLPTSGTLVNSAVTTLSSLTSAAGGAFGTAAYDNTGTSGSTIPLLSGANTWGASATQTFGSIALNSGGIGAVITGSSAEYTSMEFVDTNTGGQTWQMGPGVGIGSATSLNVFNSSNSTTVLEIGESGLLTVASGFAVGSSVGASKTCGTYPTVVGGIVISC